VQLQDNFELRGHANASRSAIFGFVEANKSGSKINVVTVQPYDSALRAPVCATQARYGNSRSREKNSALVRTVLTSSTDRTIRGRFGGTDRLNLICSSGDCVRSPSSIRNLKR
jgi:hypothetical protein